VINLARINNQTLLGQVLRMPLRLLPCSLVVPILQGPLRGMRWIVGASVHGCWIGCYEVEKQRACVRLSQPGMVAYDLGANVGFYSLLFSRLVKPEGSVHAFEPLPRNCSLLKRHLALNRVENVAVHSVAVAEKSGTACFDAGPNPSMGHLVALGGTLKVPTVALDEFVYVYNQPAPNIVKMDIEGGEIKALAGMHRLLREKRPWLLIALHGEEARQECTAMLASVGYRLTDLLGHTNGGLPATDEIVALPDEV
jgi:FkbM family methyltransferase